MFYKNYLRREYGFERSGKMSENQQALVVEKVL